MKYPKAVYKRIDGQEYFYYVSDNYYINKAYEKELENKKEEEK